MLTASSISTVAAPWPRPMPSSAVMNRPKVTAFSTALSGSNGCPARGVRGRKRCASHERDDPGWHLQREQPGPGQHRHDRRGDRRARGGRTGDHQRIEADAAAERLARIDEAHQRAVDAHDAGAAETLQHAADHQHRQRRRHARRRAMPRCRPRGPRHRRADGRRCRPSRRTAAASPSPRADRRSPPRSMSAGVTPMSRAMVGSAMLAIEVTSTDMATAIATASIARHRWCGGRPSVTSGSCTRIGRIVVVCA